MSGPVPASVWSNLRFISVATRFYSTAHWLRYLHRNDMFVACFLFCALGWQDLRLDERLGGTYLNIGDQLCDMVSLYKACAWSYRLSALFRWKATLPNDALVHTQHLLF